MIPSLFLAHGSPMTAIEDNEYTRFLKGLSSKIKPKAIVIFTAHWESDILTISSSDETYDTIYDFGGFPQELYEIKYPAKGSGQLAQILKGKFEQKGIAVREDVRRGLDHGSWTLLYQMYPAADIPVVQISVNPYLEPEKQFEIGETLKGMGKENILVIGSGVTVHNLRAIKWGQQEPDQWAVDFDDWLIDKIKKEDLQSLFKYEMQAPNAQIAVPTPEHFMPFFIAMGSGETQPTILHRSYELGNLSYLSMQF